MSETTPITNLELKALITNLILNKGSNMNQVLGNHDNLCDQLWSLVTKLDLKILKNKDYESLKGLIGDSILVQQSIDKVLKTYQDTSVEIKTQLNKWLNLHDPVINGASLIINKIEIKELLAIVSNYLNYIATDDNHE